MINEGKKKKIKYFYKNSNKQKMYAVCGSEGGRAANKTCRGKDER